MTTETSQTLGRGLRVLELLADRPRGMSVTELAEQMGVGRTVVYRLVATLVEHGFAQRDAEGRVRLGWAALVLARSARPLLRGQALPVLRQLADAIGATAHLSCAEGDDALAIAVVEPRWTDFHVGYREGSRHSLSLGAAGRAILQARDGPPQVVRSVGELQPGAHGVAVAVVLQPGRPARPTGESVEPGAGIERNVELGASRLELSLGVVALAPLPASVDVAVKRAADELADRLTG